MSDAEWRELAGRSPAGEPIALLDIGRGDPPLELLIGQAQDLSQFPDASVDVAYLNSVLNWVGDRPKAFDEAYRVLKPCGRRGIGTTVRERPNQLWLNQGPRVSSEGIRLERYVLLPVQTSRADVVISSP